ncbi:hypothetical protein ACS0TY_008645 [Phlomoides rotata]
MDLEKTFHMKGGLGETSYPKNSSLQKRAADKVKHIKVGAIEKMLLEIKPVRVGIADLGCSSGPNTLSNIKELIEAVENIQGPEPEIHVYLNDLPTNDFNTVFRALPEFYMDLRKQHGVYIGAYPGTFYGRLFPHHSLHFLYSSSSLHWLSTVPRGIYDEDNLSLNKKSICISKRSPSVVSEAYYKQFQQDFSLFLKSRSEEVVSGGRMVLIMLGRSGESHVDRGISLLWEILYQSLATFVIQGEVEEEKLDNYEVNFYAPSKEELEDEVRKEGSFKIEVIEKFEADKVVGGNYSLSYGVALAKAVRSIQEPMIERHFGQHILDRLFQLYGKLVDQELGKEDISSITIALVLTKL